MISLVVLKCIIFKVVMIIKTASLWDYLIIGPAIDGRSNGITLKLLRRKGSRVQTVSRSSMKLGCLGLNFSLQRYEVFRLISRISFGELIVGFGFPNFFSKIPNKK